MPTLPPKMIRLLTPFAPLFSKRLWQNVQVLLMGAILTPPLRRTLSCALRAMGLDQHKRFHRYHRLLSHVSWSSLKASRGPCPAYLVLAPSERYGAKRGKRHKKITE